MVVSTKTRLERCDDAWGHAWRGVEQHRYDNTVLCTLRAARQLESAHGALRFLDVGCTTGHVAARFAAAGHTVKGVDISEEAIRQARETYPNIDFRVVDPASPCGSEGGFYHVITCLEVLYYLGSAGARPFLEVLASHLEEGGVAVFSSLVGSVPYFHPNELVTLVAGAFEVEAVSYYGWRAYLTVERSFFRLYKKLERLERLLAMRGGAGDHERSDSAGSISSDFVRRVASFLIARETLRRVSRGTSRTLRSLIVALFSRKWPAESAHRIARRLSLCPSHAVVVARKRSRRMEPSTA